MALFKSLLQRKQPNYILSTFRISCSSTRHCLLKSFSTSSNLQISQSHAMGSSYHSSKKMSPQFGYSRVLSNISYQIRNCIKGLSDQEDILRTYSAFKGKGEVSGGDSVRILYRLATLRGVKLHCDDRLIRDLYKVLIRDIVDYKTQLKPMQIADVFFSLGKLGSSDSDVFHQFGSLIEKTSDLSGFSKMDIAMILWAHGKAHIPSHAVFTALEEEIFKRGLGSFSAKDISQLTWSFARVGKRSPFLFEEAAKEIVKNDITELSNLDIYMLLWAFSKMGKNVESLFTLIKTELLNSRRLTQALCSDLAVILWSFANQDIIACDLFSSIERELVMRNDKQLDEQSVVFIAWSFAHTNNNSPAIFKLVKHNMTSISLEMWSLESLVRVLWAFTKSGSSSSFLHKAVTSAMAESDLHDLPQDTLDEMAFILQKCNLSLPPELVSSIEKEITRSRAESTNSEHNN